MSLHYQSIKVWIYHRILQSGRQSLSHEPFPTPAFSSKSLTSCQMAPQDPSLPISTPLSENPERSCFSAFAAQTGFQWEGRWKEGECFSFESHHFIQILVMHPMGRKDTCTHVQSDIPRVSHFPSYTHHLQFHRHRMQSISGTFLLHDFSHMKDKGISRNWSEQGMKDSLKEQSCN